MQNLFLRVRQGLVGLEAENGIEALKSTSCYHQRILEMGTAFLQKPFLPMALIKKAHEVLSDE